MKEAMYWKKEKDTVHCTLCPHNCQIPDGSVGFCGVRKNIKNKLYSLVYARPATIAIDPIEKKPLYHFLAGENALSLGTVGCNFACLFCQNWTLSRSKPQEVEVTGKEEVSPEEVIRFAKEKHCRIIAYTYNEPTIFYEYMLDCAKLARKQGIKNVIVSNGYIQEEPLKELCKVIDGANIDLKSFSDNFYKRYVSGKLEPVLESLKILKKNKVWLEVTNLIIPTLNDDMKEIEEMCKWIVDNLGQIPLHFSRFYPHYKLKHIEPTPEETLVKAREIAKKYLDHVYVGNLRTKSGSNTYCPECNELLIERQWFSPTTNHLVDGKCPNCKADIGGVWN